MGIFGDKPWFKSLTGLGAALFAAVQVLEQTGMVAPGAAAGGADTSGAIVTLVESISALLVVLGIRRAAN